MILDTKYKKCKLLGLTLIGIGAINFILFDATRCMHQIVKTIIIRLLLLGQDPNAKEKRAIQYVVLVYWDEFSNIHLMAR